MTNQHPIFYGAAIQGALERSDRAHVNVSIIQTIKSFGFTVITEHTKGLDVDDTANKLTESIGPLPPPGDSRTTFIRDKMIQFVESDIHAAVFEVSTPSLGTGIEIAHAYLRPRMGLSVIPVIALYQKGFWPNNLSAMIRGISDGAVAHFHLIEYDNVEDAATKLEQALKSVNTSCPADTKNTGRIIARKCACCGHHEIGIEKENGEYVALKPGMHAALF